MIRKLLSENTDPVKIPKDEDMQLDIDFKKEFQKNANQQSLQRLRYIHWCNPHEVQSILTGSGKNEISTCIHSRKHPLVPWDMDESFDGDVPTVGIELRGFVTMASNLDLDSGRHYVNFGRTHKLHPHKEFQKITSGIPKRSMSTIYKDRSYNYKNFGLIYSEKDLKIYDGYDYDSENAEWPEAILDNWKPIAMWYDDSRYDPITNHKLASVIQRCKDAGLKIKKASRW